MRPTERIERRHEPRWIASGNSHQVSLLSADGRLSRATIVDISASGIGLRADHGCFSAGMRLRIQVELADEGVELSGVVRFADRYYPRIGLQIDSVDVMDRVIRYMAINGFMMAEVKGDTLFVKGSVKLAAAKVFDAIQGHRKLDLSEVNEISMGGARHVQRMIGAGVKIASCSESVAPRFDSLGICEGARFCVADSPCDLPKTWPMRAEFLARRNRADDPECIDQAA